MDIKDFYGIGVVEVLLQGNDLESWKKAFIEIYFPDKVGNNDGERYCLKYTFLDNNNLIVSEDLFEDTKLGFSYEQLDENSYLVNMLSNKHKFNSEQLKYIIDLINIKKNL